MKKGLVFFIILVLVVLAVIFVPGNKDENQTIVVAEDNAIVVADQIPGTEATVHYVKMQNPGYAVVYGVDENGQEMVLGVSSLLAAGEHYNVKVPLSQELLSGVTIRAQIAADNGDEVYSDDDQIVFDAGMAVDAEAMISEGASEEIDLVVEIAEEGYMIVSEEENSEISEEMTDGKSEDETLEEGSMEESNDVTSEEMSEGTTDETTEETAEMPEETDAQVEGSTEVEVEVDTALQ